jgi:23S rRNA G2445 N2-methylase RlmL
VPSSAGKRYEGFSRRGTAIHCTLHILTAPDVHNHIHIHFKSFNLLVCISHHELPDRGGRKKSIEGHL